MNKSLSLMIMVLTMVLSGCKSTPETIENGFLPTYLNLETIREESGRYQQRWASRKLTRKIKPITPKAFYIKPIIYYPELSYQAQFSKEAAVQLSDYLNQQIKSVVGKHFDVVDTLQPGVFVIEPAITSVRISLEDLSPLEVIPFRAAIASINYAMGGRDRDVEIRLETKIWHHDKNELVATTVHGGEGVQLENDLSQFTTEHVKELIDGWMNDWDTAFLQYSNRVKKRD